MPVQLRQGPHPLLLHTPAGGESAPLVIGKLLLRGLARLPHVDAGHVEPIVPHQICVEAVHPDG